MKSMFRVASTILLVGVFFAVVHAISSTTKPTDPPTPPKMLWGGTMVPGCTILERKNDEWYVIDVEGTPFLARWDYALHRWDLYPLQFRPREKGRMMLWPDDFPDGKIPEWMKGPAVRMVEPEGVK